MLSELSIGIISGLMTAFIIIVVGMFWNKIIIPWYEELLFKDIKIEGIWNGYLVDKYLLMENRLREPSFEQTKKLCTQPSGDIDYQPAEVRVEITRKGYRIEGKVIAISGSDKGDLHNIKGNFKNLILSGLYEANNSAIIDRGSFSVMAIDNGTVLKGFFSSYENSTNSIRPFYCILKKN